MNINALSAGSGDEVTKQIRAGPRTWGEARGPPGEAAVVVVVVVVDNNDSSRAKARQS